MRSSEIIVIGGGAAGFFGAIAAAERGYKVTILEKGPKTLTKVRISGGGRCNVTHSCFEPRSLAQHYPRGEKELISLFHQFQPKDTIQWFKDRGVALKTEADGRMFPTTDNSETIIECLHSEAKRLNVDLQLKSEVIDIKRDNKGFTVILKSGTELQADSILIATGGAQNNKIFSILENLGHKVTPRVPSLFTFNIKDPRLEGLPGISFPEVSLKIEDTKLQSRGPLLITHWGLSGPAILRLSAWGASELHSCDYNFSLLTNFLPGKHPESILSELKSLRSGNNKKLASKHPAFELPKRFWERMLTTLGISSNASWNTLSNSQLQGIQETLNSAKFSVQGKSTNKDEFVTCGGIDLKEVNMKRLESKLVPNLYFAGEVLNIDGITGGFNFQAAWSTSYIAAQSLDY